MKAYGVHDKNWYSDYTVIVFAETVGRAKSIALGTDEYPYPDWQYIELMAWRIPVLDECYRGHSIMDWYDDKDRYDLVTKWKTWCGSEYYDERDCELCCAKDVCEGRKEMLEELEKENSDETLA